MKLLVVLTGFFVGGALVVGLAFALPQTTVVTARPTTTNMGMQPMSGGMPSLATKRLTIQHAQKGCHVWSDGQMTGSMMRLHLTQGQELSILDLDVDPHQLLELAGPMHLRMGGPMMMNQARTLSFTKKGVYRLGTKTVEVDGGGMEEKTVGPDNNLTLVVTVA